MRSNKAQHDIHDKTTIIHSIFEHAQRVISRQKFRIRRLPRLPQRASIMVSATEILVSGVSWPRKNTEDHGKLYMAMISVFFRAHPWLIP
jgi:hypothetical protein